MDVCRRAVVVDSNAWQIFGKAKDSRRNRENRDQERYSEIH
jgi:hypothetical protein